MSGFDKLRQLRPAAVKWREAEGMEGTEAGWKIDSSEAKKMPISNEMGRGCQKRVIGSAEGAARLA